jgi:nucleoside-diphosphate-sugar epimerase
MVEVRASDYVEANSIFSDGVAKPMLAGKRVLSPAPLDVPHSWTSVRDVARTLTAAAADDSAHGRGWLVPTNAPLTVRQIAERFAEVRGLGKARLATLPYAVLWFGGLFDPIVKELRATRYQFAQPFVIDSSLTEKTLGLAPTPLEEALRGVGA